MSEEEEFEFRLRFEQEQGATQEDAGAEPNKLGEFGKQASGGAISGTSVMGGAATGAALGAFAPPGAQLVTVPIGAGLGAAYGYYAGEQAKKGLGIRKPEELAPELRSAAYAGEVFGGSLPFSSAPIMAAKAGFQFASGKVGSFLNKVIDWAGKSPKAYMIAETGAAGSAALASGAAEEIAPGETGVRIGAEVVGGMLNPAAHFTNAGRYTAHTVKNVINKLSASGRETIAAKSLQDALNAAGEDAELLAKILRDQSKIGGTAAQKTGSPTLTAMERGLAQKNQNIAAEAEGARTVALDITENSIAFLRGTGDPSALKAASDIQAGRFRAAIGGMLQSAEDDAVAAAGKITQDSPKARIALSMQIRSNLDNAMSQIRKVESELWEKVPQDVPASAQATVARYQQIRSQMLEREPMPQVIEGTINDLIGVKARTSSGELIKLRKRMLSLARESDIQGKANDARIYGELADSVLQDLDNMKTNPAFGAYGRHAQGYDDARAFSKEFHDTFTRTFAGQTTETAARGRERIPPELLARRMLATGDEAAELHFREVEEAMRFLPSKGLGGDVELAQTIEAQDRILRLAASDAVDPSTGKVSASRLMKIINKQDALLDRFPEVKADLLAAAKTQEKLNDLTKSLQGVNKVAEQKATWAKLVKYENPVDAIGSAVAAGTKSPVDEISKMANVAIKGGKDAVEGMKASVMDHVLRKAQSGEKFSFAKANAAFIEPIRPGQPSLADILVKKKIISSDDVARFKELIVQAERIESTIKQHGVFDPVDHFGFIVGRIIRYFGARVATGISKATGGSTVPSLQIAAGGAEVAKRIGISVPEEALGDIFSKAMFDGEFAAMLLEKPITSQEKFKLGRRMHAYLFQAGLLQSPDITGQEISGQNE